MLVFDLLDDWGSVLSNYDNFSSLSAPFSHIVSSAALPFVFSSYSLHLAPFEARHAFTQTLLQIISVFRQ